MNTAETLVPASPDEDPAAAVARIETLSQRLLTPIGPGNMLWHVWGQGKPLVLLHGGFGSWLHWIRNIPEMASRFTIFAACLPGFGESDDLPEPQTIENLAKIVSAGINQLLPPKERFHMLGFSFYIQNRNTPLCRVRTYKYWQMDILREPLCKVKGRLMGLYGSSDAIVSGHMHERLNYLRAIQPDLLFREIDGAGHWACYETAEAFNRTYFEMLHAIA